MVFGVVVVRVRVNGAVAVRVRVFVLGGVLMLMLVVVVGVTVFVRVLDAVRMLVGMLVLLGHGARFESPAAGALPRPITRRARPV